MGRRGRPPTPTVLKLAHGNRGHQRLNREEPRPPRERPRCPRHLGADAKRHWRELSPLLDSMGVLTLADRDALAHYCRLWAEHKRLTLWLAEHGESFPVRDQTGNVLGVKALPQVRMVADMERMMHRYQQEFGLTPSSRSNIIAPNREQKASLAAFVATKEV